jgi:hypothetical protein
MKNGLCFGVSRTLMIEAVIEVEMEVKKVQMGFRVSIEASEFTWWVSLSFVILFLEEV